MRFWNQTLLRVPEFDLPFIHLLCSRIGRVTELPCYTALPFPQFFSPSISEDGFSIPNGTRMEGNSLATWDSSCHPNYLLAVIWDKAVNILCFQMWRNYRWWLVYIPPTKWPTWYRNWRRYVAKLLSTSIHDFCKLAVWNLMNIKSLSNVYKNWQVTIVNKTSESELKPSIFRFHISQSVLHGEMYFRFHIRYKVSSA